MKDGNSKMFRQHSMMALSTESISCKVVLVGDSLCGKSALINSFLGKGYGEVRLLYYATVLFGQVCLLDMVHAEKSSLVQGSILDFVENSRVSS